MIERPQTARGARCAQVDGTASMKSRLDRVAPAHGCRCRAGDSRKIVEQARGDRNDPNELETARGKLAAALKAFDAKLHFAATKSEGPIIDSSLKRPSLDVGASLGPARAIALGGSARVASDVVAFNIDRTSFQNGSARIDLWSADKHSILRSDDDEVDVTRVRKRFLIPFGSFGSLESCF